MYYLECFFVSHWQRKHIHIEFNSINTILYTISRNIRSTSTHCTLFGSTIDLNVHLSCLVLTKIVGLNNTGDIWCITKISTKHLSNLAPFYIQL